MVRKTLTTYTGPDQRPLVIQSCVTRHLESLDVYASSFKLSDEHAVDRLAEGLLGNGTGNTGTRN